MSELPHAIVYDGQPVCWCGTNHNDEDDPTFVVSRRVATDLAIDGSPRALIRDGRPEDAHPGYQADDDKSGLPPVPGSLRDISGVAGQGETAEQVAETLRAALMQWAPNGFRDEDGVWHDGPHQRAALAAVERLLVRVQELTDERDENDRQRMSRLAGEVARLRLELAESEWRVQEAERALRDNERDARWMVGQWQRLHDEPVKEVALAIVARCGAVLGGGDGQQEPLDNTQATARRDIDLMVEEDIVSVKHCVQCGGVYPNHEEGCVREREDIDRTTGLTADDGSGWRTT